MNLRKAREPFVGREDEMRKLVSALEDAVAGNGRIATISGEPGIGKTRCAEELSAEARERGSTTLCAMVLAMFGAGLLDCSYHATGAQLRKRASFDFQCPEAELELRDIDYETVGVTGCGQQATYVEDCEGTACKWVLNTDSRAAPQ